MEYSCERCGYTTSVLYNLKMHYRRKIVCPPELSDVSVTILYNETFYNVNKKYTCEYCDKSYFYAQGKCNHKKKCKKKIEYDLKLTQDKAAAIEQLAIVVEQQQKQIEELSAKTHAQNQIIHGNNANHSHNTNNATQNNHNSHNNITNNITINAFGKENTDYLIKDPNYKKFMIGCLQKHEQGIIELIEHIYYNQEHPENHNVRKVSKNDKFMKTYNGNKWGVIFAKEGLEKILNRINTEFLRFLEVMEDDNERVKEPIMKNFMKKVGNVMEYDFSIFDYDYDNDKNDEESKRARNELNRLYLYYIHERTKEQLQEKLDMKIIETNEDVITENLNLHEPLL